MNILAHEYNAAKRREYYLRTRNLKGRKSAAERQKELEATVSRLKNKVEQLRSAVQAAVEAAQRRSGISKNSSEKAKSKTHSQSGNSSKQHKTAAQKAKAAKAAKNYRDKNSALAAQVHDLNNKIAGLRKRLEKLKQGGSVGASKTTTH